MTQSVQAYVRALAQGLALMGGGAVLLALGLTLFSTLGKNLRRALDSAFGNQQAWAGLGLFWGKKSWWAWPSGLPCSAACLYCI